MAIENSVSGAEASAIGLKFPSFSNAEWLKPFSEGPGKFYAAAWNEALGLTASHLQEQADYAKALSECTDPAEAFKYSTEFVQNVWKRSYSDGSKFFESWRANLSSAAHSK